MTDFERLFAKPVGTSHGTESNSKPPNNNDPSDHETQPKSELCFWRGLLAGIALTVGLFMLGDHLGIHRREAVHNGICALLDEWTAVSPNASAAEILDAISAGKRAPQKTASTSNPASNINPPAK